MVIRIGINRSEIKKLASCGSSNKTALDRLCAFLLSISPILQHYRGPIENAGFTVLVICFPVLALRFFLNVNAKKINADCLAAIAPLLIFEAYTMVVRMHRVSAIRLFSIFFIFCIFLFVASGCVNTRFFLHYVIGISCIAAVLVIIQYLVYYGFHYPLDFRPFSLLDAENTRWVRLSETTGSGRMLRPAAFFLEPSHMFLYCFPALLILLLTPGKSSWRRNKAILISIGMILSTSGMGIAVTLGAWTLYYIFFSGRKKRTWLVKLFSTRTIIMLIAMGLLSLAAYSTVPFFRKSINRILIGSGNSTAISGRIRRAGNYVQGIRGWAVLFGTANVVGGLGFNLAGFFSTYIKWGVIGVFLTYLFYVQGVFRLQHAYKMISVIIVIVSFFSAHTHGTFYMLYYVVLLMEGYYGLKLNAKNYKEARGLLYE